MMRAVEALRQRVPAAEEQNIGYAPVYVSESEDDDEGIEMLPLMGEGSRDRSGSRVGGRRPRGGQGLAPHYTPLYSNMKVLRRKQLDASLAYGRAGPCTKLFFVVSVWGVLFLSWVGFTLASGSPYMLEKENIATKVALSHSVFGAAAMYFVCACLSGFCWYKTACGTRRLPTLGDSSV